LRPTYPSIALAGIMPLYGVIGRHEANGCPTTSKGAKAVAMKAYGGAEQVLKAKHFKWLLDLHLDQNHMASMLFEAPSAEAVRDSLMQSGMGSFLGCNLPLETPISELLEVAGDMPTYDP
jgi:hypothetical protein